MRRLLPLYLGKTAGVITAGVFLPIYGRLLGAESFGWISLLLSLQGLALLLDLGSSTQAANVFAKPSSGAEQASARTLGPWLRSSEALLASLHLIAGVFLTGLAIHVLGWRSPSLLDVLLGWIVIACSPFVNLYQTALQAAGCLWASAAVSMSTHLLRALVTWICLHWLGASLSIFLASQALFTVLQLLVSRATLQGMALKHERPVRADDAKLRMSALWQELRQRTPLIASGFVGALAMQLDKPLISLFMSPAALAPYFLAFTLAGAPLAVLGGPLAQHVQSALARAHQEGRQEDLRAHFRQGQVLMMALVVVPMGLMAAFADTLARLWLHDAPYVADVARYARWLLLAHAIGAFGYIPYAASMARGDFGHQARLSALTASLQVVACTLAAMSGHVEALCAVFLVYFLLSTAGLWHRNRDLLL